MKATDGSSVRPEISGAGSSNSRTHRSCAIYARRFESFGRLSDALREFKAGGEIYEIPEVGDALYRLPKSSRD